MKIRSFRHKGLRRLYEGDDASGVPPATVPKLRNMLAFMDAMRTTAELRDLPRWGAHRLTGNRKGTWSLSVTRNWRLTFEEHENELELLDLEDYH